MFDSYKNSRLKHHEEQKVTWYKSNKIQNSRQHCISVVSIIFFVSHWHKGSTDWISFSQNTVAHQFLPSDLRCCMAFSNCFYAWWFQLLREPTWRSQYWKDFEFHQCQSQRSQTSWISWYLFKTQMWVLLIRRYPKFPCLLFFVQSSDEHVSIRSIYNSLG